MCYNGWELNILTNPLKPFTDSTSLQSLLPPLVRIKDLPSSRTQFPCVLSYKSHIPNISQHLPVPLSMEAPSSLNLSHPEESRKQLAGGSGNPAIVKSGY